MKAKRHFSSRVIVTVPLAAIVLMAAAPARAAQSYQTDYRVSLFGLSIAKANFSTVVSDGGAYKVTGKLSSSGLASLFDDTNGELDVTGQLAKNGPVPNSYVVKYRHGKRDKSTSIAFTNGNVTNTTNVPPINKKKNWVELSPADLQSVADPISGVMVSASSLDKVCKQTLHLYDGQTRVDLKLSPSGGAKPFATQGFKGDAITCTAKFVPIAGYQSGRKAIEYLKNSSRISLTFASFGKSAIYSPVQAKIGTQIGTVAVYATRFEKTQ
ncbi:DUF3108 domain-containing protein [Phyllobacterium zundukense]|uniref:DUF3108 domain-containing protein n=1 Tax=Phyllobacterium zundukense TaxID=1867719 RepID=A0A2N9W0B0_9HYPH|nr:DUF3108 domain-containing protein [Phyllobacterium zundukense]ATU90582.1 hypothetical protein BLM14_02115 [Phyllobacterium zundukense]PIO45178.1 hypothetical protein B5P45_09045 [Phyllobacterium zundukense]